MYEQLSMNRLQPTTVHWLSKGKDKKLRDKFNDAKNL